MFLRLDDTADKQEYALAKFVKMMQPANFNDVSSAFEASVSKHIKLIAFARKDGAVDWNPPRAVTVRYIIRCSGDNGMVP